MILGLISLMTLEFVVSYDHPQKSTNDSDNINELLFLGDQEIHIGNIYFSVFLCLPTMHLCLKCQFNQLVERGKNK